MLREEEGWGGCRDSIFRFLLDGFLSIQVTVVAQLARLSYIWHDVQILIVSFCASHENSSVVVSFFYCSRYLVV